MSETEGQKKRVTITVSQVFDDTITKDEAVVALIESVSQDGSWPGDEDIIVEPVTEQVIVKVPEVWNSYRVVDAPIGATDQEIKDLAADAISEVEREFSFAKDSSDWEIERQIVELDGK
jgi:hypothetical protein